MATVTANLGVRKYLRVNHLGALVTVTTNEDWLTTDELAAELKVSPETIRDWRKKRSGPQGVKIGQAVRYSRRSVAEWIAQTNGLVD